MFDEETYKFLKNGYFFKRLRYNCILGAAIVFVIGVALILLGTLVFDGITLLVFDIIGAFCMLVPIGYIIKRDVKPYMCTLGKVKAINGNTAIITIGDTFVKGTSFEHFLKNSSLKDYSEGDKVVVYSAGRKFSRVLFYHVNWLTD